MPTIEASKKDLEKLIGKKFSMNELKQALLYVKGELDAVEGDALKIDIKDTNRPDLWSAEGIAREIKTRIGLRKGILKYKVNKSKYEITIDKNLEKIRPFIACAVIKDVKLDNEIILQLIQVQEKMSQTFGKKRAQEGAGLYDFDKIKMPMKYKGFKDNEIEFIPLDWKIPLKPSEILKEHEKGKAYAHLLEGKGLYPIVIDSANVVASMPPIINSEETGKITEKTKNIFLEVTGFNWKKANTQLNVLCMALADRGGKIYSVKVKMPEGKIYPKTCTTPEFKAKKMNFNLELIERNTGLKLKNSEIISFLQKAGMNASINGKKIEIEYCEFRQDIFHPVDLIEDILISYGYNNIPLQKIEINVEGKHLNETLYLDKARDACVGMGLQEILTFNLTSIEKQNELIGLKEEDLVQIANPVSKNWEILRKRITPELLEFLNKNKRFEYPQKIFEIGTALRIDESQENKVRETKNLCIILSGKGFSFNEIKSALQAVCANLGIEFKLNKSIYPFLHKEKQAEISTSKGKGFLGEINEKTVKAFGLEQDTVVMEMDL
ncbi:MAG: phenylalanine--tRNA ligase subunit beta [Candidatus Diapherotrites archaeon]